jgi:hypothetical protein
MASKLKVDEITNLNENGFITISGNTGLDLSASTSAIALPRGTTAQRPASAPAGAMRFNTETLFPEIYNGTEWVTFGSSLPAGTESDPFLYPNQLVEVTGTSGIAFFKTGSSTARNLRWFKFTHGSTVRVWVVVMSRNQNAASLFTANGVNDTQSSSSNYFKLSDAEIEYITNKNNNPDRYALAHFPALTTNTSITMTLSLFQNADANLWRHVDWAGVNTGIPVGWSTTDASSTSPSLRGAATTDFSTTLPSSFPGSSDTNGYCGGSQVLSNWDDTGTDMWSTRFNSAGGCSYAGENSGTFSDPNGVTSGADYSGWLHVIMVS